MARGPAERLTPFRVGTGEVERSENGARLLLPWAKEGEYSDSQLDDFHGRARSDYRWRPPATLSLRARFSHPAAELRGTAGFGWWNDPFVGDRALLPFAAPRVAWFFFASPPGNLAFTGRWSGNGWFAQSLNVPSLLRLGLVFALHLLRLPVKSGRARRLATRLARAGEQPLDGLDLTEWHAYRIEWRPDRTTFIVDGEPVLQGPSPRGPLAVVIWMDNQFASIHGRAGTLTLSAEQWMEIEELDLWQEFSP